MVSCQNAKLRLAGEASWLYHLCGDALVALAPYSLPHFALAVSAQLIDFELAHQRLQNVSVLHHALANYHEAILFGLKSLRGE
jgi:hypothetical protein